MAFGFIERNDAKACSAVEAGSIHGCRGRFKIIRAARTERNPAFSQLFV
jgi:hypothetical protein